MGAWAATQEPGTPYHGRQVVSVSGDGGFGQYMAELNTAVKYGMNITHVLAEQREPSGRSPRSSGAGQLGGVADVAVESGLRRVRADLRGDGGVRVESADQLEGALTEALRYDGPALVEVVADQELI